MEWLGLSSLQEVRRLELGRLSPSSLLHEGKKKANGPLFELWETDSADWLSSSEIVCPTGQKATNRRNLIFLFQAKQQYPPLQQLLERKKR